MSLIAYNLTVPATSHNPSDDQPEMLINTNAIDTIWNRDHFGFNESLSGYHDIIHMPNNSTPSAIPGPPAIGQVFCQTVASDIQLFYISGGGVISQLTSSVTPTPATNGYTFLPGGILLQWGIATIPSGSHPTGTVLFATSNINFAPSGCYNVSLTLISKNSGTNSSNNSLSLKGGTISNTGFSWQCNPDSSGDFINFYWTAIGLA